MRYMLDTNICSYILKNHPAVVKQKFEEVGVGNICISAIVLNNTFLFLITFSNPGENTFGISILGGFIIVCFNYLIL